MPAKSIRLRRPANCERFASLPFTLAYHSWDFNPAASFQLGENTLVRLGYEHFKDERVADGGAPQYYDTTTAANVVMPGYTIAEAALFYDISENLTLQANVRNLFDKRYYVNAHTNNNITPGSPRAFTAALTARF